MKTICFTQIVFYILSCFSTSFLKSSTFFYFSIVKQDLSKLSDLPKSKKVAFIDDLKALIDFYQSQSDDETPIID